MMRLTLAPNPIEGIEEKKSSYHEIENPAKIPPKIKKKTLQHVKGDDSIQKHSYIDVNQEFTRFGNHSDILSLYKRLGRSLTSLLSSLRHEAHPHLAKMKT
jgi:hypothetical protein